MIDSAFDALLDPFLVKGVIAGFVVVTLGIGLWWVRGREEVQRSGGLLVAAAAMAVLAESEMVGLSQFLGVTLLAIAGLFHRKAALGVLLAIPGAFVLIGPEAGGPQAWLLWFAMVAIVFAGPLVATFDDRYLRTGLPLPLFGIATLGVFLTVPDTEGAMVLLGVAGIAGFLGWPRPFASLGGAGSFAAVGVYLFVAVEGATGRPASIIASAAVLGLLLIVPIAIRLRPVGWAHELDRVNAVFPLIAQLILVVLISRTAGRIEGVVGAVVLAAGLLAAAGTVMLVVRPPRRSHLSD